MPESRFLEKTNYHFSLSHLQESVGAVLENPEYQNFNHQICVTGRTPQDSPLTGAGSLFYDFDKNHNRILKAEPLAETDFVHFLDEFKSTYLFYVYEKLSEKFTLGRMRIMNLRPKSCYSFHHDKFQRLHIAVFSEAGISGLICNDKVYEVPCDGAAYQVDTTQRHTAFNTSLNQTRTHLVADIIQ